VERCDTADPAFGALAEAVRATIAGGLAVITSG
jgi:hypothetical protein